MKKKIIKYIKCALAATLIMSLTLPSYAAVNSADGSAFVTKAEFDAALSDFNARLTTFEAGINSKIDSQVSSYLDRNGIWNGKTQALYMNFIERYSTAVTWYPNNTLGQVMWCSPVSWVNGESSSGCLVRSRGWGNHDDWVDHTTNLISYPTTEFVVEVTPPIKIVDNISKSGLAVIYIQSGYQDMTMNCVQTDYVNWGTPQSLGVLQDVPLVTNTLGGGLHINDPGLVNVKNCLSTMNMFLPAQRVRGYDSSTKNIGLQHIADGLSTLTAFVSKDKPLYSMVWWYMNCNGGYITKSDFRKAKQNMVGLTSKTADVLDWVKENKICPMTWIVKDVIVY